MKKNNLKRKITMLSLAVTLVATPVTSLAAANVGGGVWDYGTKAVGVNKKMVWSNYYHGSKTHKSSCSIGTTASSSGWVKKGKTSYSSAVGTWTANTHAYYDKQ